MSWRVNTAEKRRREESKGFRFDLLLNQAERTGGGVSAAACPLTDWPGEDRLLLQLCRLRGCK